MCSVRAMAVASVVGISLAAAPAHADRARDRALAAFRNGQIHFKLSEYALALTAFKEAYRAKPDPVFLFNIAQCHRLLDSPAEALTFYRRYLREVTDAPNRAEVEQLIRSVEARGAARPPPTPVVAATPALTAAHAPRPAPPPLPEAPPSPAAGVPEARQQLPPPAPAFPPPAPTGTAPAVVPSAPSAPVPVDPAIGVTGVDVSPASPPLHRRWWFWAALGAVVAGGAAAVYLGTRSRPDPPYADLPRLAID